MNKKRFFTLSLVALSTLSLSSCALVRSVLSLPGSVLSTASRTIGLPVSNVEEPAQSADIDPETGEEMMPID